jgi:S1-C subfamily serine protease
LLAIIYAYDILIPIYNLEALGGFVKGFLFKKLIIGIAIGVFLLCIKNSNQKTDTLAPMPIVQEKDPYLASIRDYAPVPRRDAEVSRWLRNSFKISVTGASGSGTLIYYDAQKNLAYVTSCGHLWAGNMSVNESRRFRPRAKIIVWYHNDHKLSNPREYDAEVIFYNNNRGFDVSLLVFSPDWVPDSFFPIGNPYQIEPGTKLHSTGCDRGSETAYYEVEFIRHNGQDLVTRYNSPRPGRSGGGLMNNDGYLVGICWGTSDRSGTGVGYFTPLENIHKIYIQNGYDWLLNKSSGGVARNIPIIDRNNPQSNYPPDYIPIPNF